ncbi:acyl-CoA thioester hydrolase/BAAT C-terminal domain-containing protein [Flavobacterium sp.]|uniref:alpha/beta hydrolase n=1 Tax=Flavobacterium sp. TaxID=239 RepID=UPI00286D42FB|nr:acyl-CoA thioester hydrolase/BAAT C-terminal domain-containing protein [Flavobacterium sp.]
MKISKLLFVSLFTISTIFSYAQELLIPAKNVEAVLYLGKVDKQPLVVGLGGSEGGNAWTSDYWKKTRDQFLDKGYAFLALGYFGNKNTPEILDKIEIEDIHSAILEASKNEKIAKNKIAIIGGSRGADLALLVASYYNDINCVVGLVSSHAVFPGHTKQFNSACWTYQGKELPFIPVNKEAIPYLMKRDLLGTFNAMLQDKDAEEKALIKIMQSHCKMKSYEFKIQLSRNVILVRTKGKTTVW